MVIHGSNIAKLQNFTALSYLIKIGITLEMKTIRKGSVLCAMDSK